MEASTFSYGEVQQQHCVFELFVLITANDERACHWSWSPNWVEACQVGQVTVEKPIFVLLHLKKLIPIVVQGLEQDDAYDGGGDKKKGYQ